MPEIASKMNFADSVTIQLDNARPYVGKENIQLLNDFGDTLTPEITIICQPPQSPEVNVKNMNAIVWMCYGTMFKIVLLSIRLIHYRPYLM